MIDLHNHTKLCGHAEGSPEEYIEEAIKKGFKYFGFSDHAPIAEAIRPGITMHPDETEQYIEKIISLKAAYKDKIEILLGFEVDYPLFDDFNAEYFTDKRIDYFIGSCHFIDDWSVDSPESEKDYKRLDLNRIYTSYYEIIIRLIESRLFNIVGHIDLPKKFGYPSTEDFSDIIKKIAEAAVKNDVAIEINSAGLRKPVHEMYPSEKILEILIKNKVKITFGSDSHYPDEAGSGYMEAEALLKKYGCRKLSYFKKRTGYELSI
ncbi:MAG: histidinol-phosphatase [Spirochaetes bacterium]|nr:histidinol-phosphatase [Spirochaetota bacterium]